LPFCHGTWFIQKLAREKKIMISTRKKPKRWRQGKHTFSRGRGYMLVWWG